MNYDLAGILQHRFGKIANASLARFGVLDWYRFKCFQVFGKSPDTIICAGEKQVIPVR
jgi:hypothetical protein